MIENVPLSSKKPNLWLYLLTLLIITAAIYARIRLADVPLERDEGEYAYMGQLLLKGIPPYANAYTMKLPGAAVVYALFMFLFGQSPGGIHIGFTIVNLVCAIMLYCLTSCFLDRERSLLATGFFILLSLSASVMGIFGHATHLVVLFSLIAMYLLQRALPKCPPQPVFLAGLALGFAFLMKQHGAILIPFALIFQLWLGRNRHTSIIRHACLFLAGAAIPYLAVCLWLYQAGVFEQFWFWTFRYAAAYANRLTMAQGLHELSQQLLAIVKATLPTCLFGIAGVYFLTGDKQIAPRYKMFLLGYLVTSLIMIAQGFYFRPHYFVLALPPVAIFAALGAQHVAQALSARWKHILPVLIFTLAAAYCFIIEGHFLFRATPAEASRTIYGANPFPEAVAIGDYLHRQTGTGDRIAILGSEPEILFYADRISATGHIYMYGLMENHPYAEAMQRQLISEIEASAPAYIVVVNNPASWLLQTDSVNKVLDWGDTYIPLRYDEVGMVEIFADQPSRFIWGAEAANRQPQAASFVSIFKKRS